MFRGLIFAGLFLLHVCVLAQTDYTVMHYTTENGLPSNGIKGVAYDANTGYLWIGSEAGIIRFNGTQFSVFNNMNTPGMASNRLDFMEQSVDGNIYARDQSWNWFKIDKNQPKFFHKSSMNPASAEREYLDLFLADNELKSIINNFEPHKRYYHNFLALGDSASLMMYYENRMAYACKNKKLFKLFDNSIKAYVIFKIKNTVYAWTIEKGLCVFNPSTITFTPTVIYNENGQIIPIDIKTHQIIGNKESTNTFLFRENEIWAIDEINGQLQAKKICNKFPIQTLVRSICIDTTHNMIFVSTSSKGLVMLKPNQVLPQKSDVTTNQVRNSHYSQVVVDSYTVLTNNGVLLGKPTKNRIPIPLSEYFYATVYLANDSLLIYLSSKTAKNDNSHISVYNYTTQTNYDFPKIKSLEVFSSYYDKGRIYMNTTFGMGYIEGDSLHYLFRNQYPFVSDNKSFGMEKIAEGVFWVASCEGLIEFDLNKNKRSILLQMPGVCVRNIRRIDNDIYIGTYGKGFYIYRNKQLRAMPLDKNNYLAFAHCFMPDKFGYIWISTNRGLFKASKKDLQEAFDQKESSLYYHYLGKADGMEITEMNGGCTPCAVQMNAETISFPTMDGLLWVNPNKSGTLFPVGDIYIDKVVVDNKAYSPDSFFNTKLPAASNNIDIHLDYLAWCNKENIYIEYKLNKTETWKRLNNEAGSIIHFENLSGGNYSLHIRKRNGFGINNYFYKEVRFTINTPFYKRGWFIVLSILGFIGLIALAFKMRTQQLIRQKENLQEQINQKTKSLQKQNEVLEKSNQINSRLISIISHDIITPLKFMALGSKKLLDKKHVMPQTLQEETITEITNTATELQSLSTNILNWIKYQNKHRRQQAELFAPADVIQQVFKILAPIAAEKNIQLMSDVDNQLFCTQFREPFKILIYNLITNAIQFSTHCIISVEAMVDKEELTLTVNDAGVGMTDDQIQNIMSDEFIISSVNVDNKKGNGLGYLIIKDLLKLLQGQLSIQSEKGKGTAVSFTVPQTLPNS
jgi:signal transduction histidine kinase